MAEDLPESGRGKVEDPHNHSNIWFFNSTLDNVVVLAMR